MRQIIDSRLASRIPMVWPSRCTIMDVVYTTSASNQKVPSGTAPVAGMVNISCRLAPFRLTRIEDEEKRGNDILGTYSLRTLAMNGYFPSIVAERMQASVDGAVYSIHGIEFDGERQNTRLKLAVIKPGS